MKLLIALITILTLSLLVSNKDAIAHINGQSVFKINGVYTKVELKGNSQSVDEQQDIAPEKYGVNQPVNFELDIAKFPTNKNIFEKTNFIWDFGDGTSKQVIKFGYKNSHAYPKVGSYILTIYADYTTAGFTLEPQLLQTVEIPVSSSVVQSQPTKAQQNTDSNIQEIAYKASSKQQTSLVYLFPISLLGVGIVSTFLLRRKRKRK